MAEYTRFKYNQEAGSYYEYLKDKRFKSLHEDERKRAKIIYTIAFAKGISVMPRNFKWKSAPGDKKDVRLEIFETVITEAVIRQKFKIDKLEPSFKLEVYRFAIEKGLLLLQEEEQSDSEQFFLSLLNHNKSHKKALNQISKLGQKINIPIPISVSPISLCLGKDNEGGNVNILYNCKDHNQFIGITGKSGSGKTQLLKDLIAQIVGSNPDISVIAFDLAKGDIAGDEKFINSTKLNVIDVQKNGLPYNPFMLSQKSRKKIDELKEILISIQPNIGTAQSQSLFSYLEELYDNNENVDVCMVNDFIANKYAELKIKPDSISQLLHAMSIHEIFPSIQRKDVFQTIYDQHVIFDLHEIDSKVKIKELIMFFILDKIYKEARSMNEAKEDPQTGMRELRTVIVLDEAHNILSLKNNILEKMLRELRSKGIGIIILTQAYGDYDQKNFDYSSQINWTLLLRSDNNKKSIEKALGVPSSISEELRHMITHAETGEIYARKFRESDNDYTTLKANQFYKRFLD